MKKLSLILILLFCTIGFSQPIGPAMSKERLEDYVGAMMAGTETLISVGYDDVNGLLNFVVDEPNIDHDALTNFLAAEHIDWTACANDINTTGTGRIGGGLTIGGEKTSSFTGIAVNPTLNPASAAQGFTGLNFTLLAVSSSENIAGLTGAQGTVGTATESDYSGTIASIVGVSALVSTVGNLTGGDPCFTNAYLFKGDWTDGAGPYITTTTNAYGLYLPAITAGDTLNYAIYSAGGLSYHAGQFLFGDKALFTQVDGNEYIDSLADGYLDLAATTAIRLNADVRIGSAVAPTVALDVTGAVLISTTLGVGGNLSMGNDALIAVDVDAGITASTNQTQGQGALTAQINEISTVANDDDTVTLPSAVTGIEIEIINNGVNTLQIFPASGDNLGLGPNTPEELMANERVKLVAYTTTNWAKESSTEIIHAEIHDEDNTDAFVINDAGADFHSYHTNGLAAGDLADWAFDAGGAGTSHAIASIADGVDSGVDIEVTTGDNHLLSVGDIVSQTNLADTNYVGIFDVKAIISATEYEVAAPFTADGTGTMDQAATLEADAVAAGVYFVTYYISGKPVGANETFDFQLYKEATVITGTKTRRKFGAGGDFGSSPGGGVVAVASGDKISFALSNEDSNANFTIRNLTIVLVRL